MYYFQKFKGIQYKKREEILKLQEKKMRSVINYAYNESKFYHDIFKEYNLTPNDIKTVSDLNKLPIINKNAVKSNLSDVITVQNKNSLRQLRTSGSTGSPFYIYINTVEDYTRKAIHLRANANLGQKIRDRWYSITAPHHYGELTNLQKLLNIYCSRPISVFLDTAEQVRQLYEVKPDILEGYATSLYLFAKKVDEIGNPGIFPRYFISSSEILYRNYRNFIEDIFQVPVYDQYACVEFGRVAWECGKRVGYHIDADNIIIQFLDNEGEEVSPGETGRIICTSLFNYSMPFIRYSIGDLGSPADASCDCGVNLPLMNSIEGREDSLIQLPNGQEMSPRALSVALSYYKYYDKLRQFQIIQKKLDFFKIFLCLADKEFNHNVLTSELESHLLDLFKEKFIFDIEIVEHIPPHKSGKHKYVISELES